MRHLSTFLLALMLAAAPVAEAAGYDGHGHGHGGNGAAEGLAATNHADGGHHGDAGSPAKDDDCEETGADHCCGDGGPACLSSYLPGRAPGQAVLSVAAAPHPLCRDSGPVCRHPECDPPPPRG